MTLIFGREGLLSSGCVQVHDLTTYNNRILEHRLHSYSGLRFKLCTCIETYQLTMVIRPILKQSYQLHMRAAKEHTCIIKKHFV